MNRFSTILKRLSLVAMVAATLAALVPADAFAQRRGGSFGGSRSSGRSYSTPRSGGGSFGGRRSAPSTAPTRRAPSGSRPPSSFGSRPTTRPSSTPSSIGSNRYGGSRLSSSQAYTSRYGVPRQAERRAIPNGSGGYQNVTVNRYGGMGDGFMMGYLMGSIPWYYSMPFHPAFYYSRPYTVANPDGSTAVYPGTFQFGSLIMTLIVLGVVVFILWVMFKRRRQRHGGGTDDGSRSSFA